MPSARCKPCRAANGTCSRPQRHATGDLRGARPGAVRPARRRRAQRQLGRQPRRTARERRRNAAAGRAAQPIGTGHAAGQLHSALGRLPPCGAQRRAASPSPCCCRGQLHLPHGYWLPMTAAIVLRPDFAATFNFGLLRVVGTVLGLLLTTALLHLAPNEPWAHLALMAVLCMGFRYLATAHYGVAVAALTGTVVILLSFEGVEPGGGGARSRHQHRARQRHGLARLRGLAHLGAHPCTRTHWPTCSAPMPSYLQALTLPEQRARASRGTNRCAHRAHQRAGFAGAHARRTGHATGTAGTGQRAVRQRQPAGAHRHDAGGADPRPRRTARAERNVRFRRTGGASHCRTWPPRCATQQPLPAAAAAARPAAQPGRAAATGGRHQAAAASLVRLSDRLVDNVNTLAHVVERSRTPTTGTTADPRRISRADPRARRLACADRFRLGKTHYLGESGGSPPARLRGIRWPLAASFPNDRRAHP